MGKKNKGRKFRRSKLESTVFKVPFKFIKEDDGGKYLPFCTYSRHQGIAKKPAMCESRGCHHFYRLYFEGEGQYG